MRRLATPRAVFPNHPRAALKFDILAAFLRGEIRTDGRLGMPSRPKLISASTRTSRSTEMLLLFLIQSGMLREDASIRAHFLFMHFGLPVGGLL